MQPCSCFTVGPLPRRYVLFKPLDSKVPRMVIPFNQCPKDLFSRVCEDTQFLCSTRLIGWVLWCIVLSG
jgi:hypothetical protein